MMKYKKTTSNQKHEVILKYMKFVGPKKYNNGMWNVL